MVHRTQSAEKHLCEDAFDAWRFGASPEMCEASMDLLEISASTEEVSKDTQANPAKEICPVLLES